MKKYKEMIDQKVKSGLYESPSEVIMEGLELLRDQDLLKQIRKENKIKEGKTTKAEK